MGTRESRLARIAFSLQQAGKSLLLGALVVLAACQKDAPPAAEPHFSATVDGAVRYAMEGEAFYRLGPERWLIGLELNRAEGSGGLSFELQAAEPFARTYTIALQEDEIGAAQAAAQENDSTATAFLSDQDRDFTASDGVLRIEEEEDGALRGSFELHMSGYLDDQSGDASEVTVTGSFTAVREAEM